VVGVSSHALNTIRIKDAPENPVTIKDTMSRNIKQLENSQSFLALPKNSKTVTTHGNSTTPASLMQTHQPPLLIQSRIAPSALSLSHTLDATEQKVLNLKTIYTSKHNGVGILIQKHRAKASQDLSA
jgi:hypothetical protein